MKYIMFYAVIMAGGSGTRLWPISRKNSPKQVKPFIDEKTLLQKTYHRLENVIADEHIWIAANQSQLPYIEEQLPNFPLGQLSLETSKRDTAAAIGLVAARIAMRDPNATMITINSDAYVVDDKEYGRVISEIQSFLDLFPKHIVTVGIAPTYPETGYGYIKRGPVLHHSDQDSFYHVVQFTEKPDQLRATEYVTSGEYFWNSGIFAAKASHMLDLFKICLPDMYDDLMKIQSLEQDGKDHLDEVHEIFSQIQKISIDYGILEKVDNIAMIPAYFGWSDVGNWRVLHDLQDKDENNNVLKGDVVAIKSANNLIYAPQKKVIGVTGVNDLIIVDTADALLVCDRNNSQDVKKIVESLGAQELEQYL